MIHKELDYGWEIANSPYPSPFLDRSQTFGTDDPVFLVDQYSGRQPVLLNRAFLTRGRLEIKMMPTIVLDSNMLDAIERRVSGGKKRDGLEAFLKFVVSKGWDYNALFYYLEHFAKSNDQDFIKHASRRTLALLRLHSMDEAEFISSGRIVENRESVELYTHGAGVSTLAEVAEKRVIEFSTKFRRDEVSAVVGCTRISLMKMVLINKSEMPKATLEEKQAAFFSFLKDDLGLMLGREAHLALHYFSGIAGKLVGIEASMSSENALSKIRSTAWDMFLLRLQEMFFTNGGDEVYIGYIATQEKNLDSLARLFTIERIECDRSGRILPQVSYNLSSLPKSAEKADFKSSTEPFAGGRRPEFHALHAELEEQLSKFCRA